MSTVCHLRQISSAQLDALFAKPAGITAYLGAPAPEAKSGVLGKLFGKKPQAAPAHDDAAIDLAQAWHGLHYLMTLTYWDGDEPLCYLVRGGTDLGNDLGYGPARALRPAQVTAFHTALAAMTPDTLAYCFSPEEMTRLDIYPAIWEDHEKSLAYLMEHFNSLRAFVKTAADKKQGLLVYLQ